MKDSKFPMYILSDKIFSNASIAFTLEDTKKIGEKKEGKIIYSVYECYYLISKGYANLIKNNIELSEDFLLKLFSKNNKNFFIKYLVFKHLKEKGYIVKSGLKFGGDFRVYEKNNLNHAKYIAYVVKHNEKINFEEFASKSRITHSTNKKLLLSVVDSEEDITFYEIDWKKI